MTLSPWPMPRTVTPLLLLSVATLGHLSSPVQAGPPMPPDDKLDVLAGLVLGTDVDTDKLEPPGSEEYLVALADQLEELLDDELEFCVKIGLLSRRGPRMPNADDKDRFSKSDRNAMIAEAEASGAKSRRKQSGRSAKLDSTAKRWRRGQEKIDAILDAKPDVGNLKRLVANVYDKDKLGIIDGTGLFAMRQALQAHGEALNRASTYFLAPVKGLIQDIQFVEDWRLTSKKVKKFGKEVQTGPDSKKLIENIVHQIHLVGDDNAFTDVDDDLKQYELEGYFLFSQQRLTEKDDVTDVLALVKSDDLDTAVQAVRELLVDYVRIRAFRIKRMADKVLLYEEPQITAESLFPEAAEIFAQEQDSDDRLRELQELFGAPLGNRTRTKNSKIIEWIGTLVSLTQDGQADLRVDSGIEGQPPYPLLFDIHKSPLGEQALFGRLKLGSEVVLVAKVRKLEYASDGDQTLRFKVQPVLLDERGSKSARREKSTKDSTGRTRPKRSRSRVFR